MEFHRILTIIMNVFVSNFLTMVQQFDFENDFFVYELLLLFLMADYFFF